MEKSKALIIFDIMREYFQHHILHLGLSFIRCEIEGGEREGKRQIERETGRETEKEGEIEGERERGRER